MSLLMSFTRPGGKDPAPYAESLNPQQMLAAAAILGNTLVVQDLPIRSSPLTIAKIRVWVGVQANNVDVGLYLSDGTTLTLLNSSGSTLVGPPGEQIITLPLAPVQQPGLQYYLGMCPDNVASTWGRNTSSAYAGSKISPTFAGGNRASSFPLATNAASFTLASLVATSARFWIRGSAT